MELLPSLPGPADPLQSLINLDSLPKIVSTREPLRHNLQQRTFSNNYKKRNMLKL
jgi:hypothetical protein